MKRFHKVLALALAVLMVVAMAACGSSNSQSSTQEASSTNVTYPITVKDMAGRDVTIQSQPKRIVSGYYISSSACIALGLTDKLVGIEDKSAQRPIYQLAAPQLMSLPNVGSAKAFDLETCVAAEPDLVILPMKQKDVADTLQNMGINAIVVLPESHDQLMQMLTLIGTVTNSMDRANALISYYDTTLQKVESLTAGLTDAQKPVVYMAGSSSYLNTAPKDMYQASLIKAAGGKNAGDAISGNSWAEVSYEQILTMNPDVIVIPTNNFATGAPDYTAADVKADKNLSDVTAVQKNAVYQMTTGFEAWDSPVPSGILGTLWMLQTLHPDLYSADQFAKDVSDFYQTFYGFSVSAASVTNIAG